MERKRAVAKSSLRRTERGERVVFYVPTDVATELRVRCAKDRRSISDAVTAALRSVDLNGSRQTDQPSSVREIARRAGCSEATVRRAIAGHPYVMPAMRDRVLEALDQTDHPTTDQQSVEKRAVPSIQTAPRFQDGSDTPLCCPACGSEYLHQVSVAVGFRRQEDEPESLAVAVDKTGVHTSFKRLAGRRDEVLIDFKCEGCSMDHGPFVLRIFQHKGQTFMYWMNREQNEEVSNGT